MLNVELEKKKKNINARKGVVFAEKQTLEKKRKNKIQVQLPKLLSPLKSVCYFRKEEKTKNEKMGKVGDPSEISVFSPITT